MSRKPSRATIDSALDALLAERRKSDSGWAPVTEDDLKALHRLIKLVLEAKFERDGDGDLPVEYELVNRNTHERIMVSLMRYPHKTETLQDAMEVARVAYFNVRITTDALDRAMQHLSYHTDKAAQAQKTTEH